MSDSVSEQADYDRELRAVAKGAGLALIGRTAQQLISIIAGPVTARLLRVRWYGLYALSQGVVELLSLPVTLGYPTAVARYVGIYEGAREPQRARAVALGTTLTSTALGVVVAAIVVMQAGWISGAIYHKPAMSGVLRILALSLPALVAGGLLARATVAKRTMLYDVASHLAQRVFSLLGIVSLCGPLRLGAKGAAFAVLLATTLGAAIALTGTLRLFGVLSLKDLQYYDVREIHLFALPLLLAQISSFALLRINHVIAGPWLTAAEVGKYQAASQVAILGRFGLMGINTIFSPIIADLHHRGKTDQLRDMFQTATRWIYHLTIPLMLVVLFKAESILAVFGPEFVDAALLLRLLCAGQMVNVSVGSVANVLMMSGYQWLAAADNLVMAVTNVVLCVVLTKSHGLLGLGVAATVATSGVNLLRAVQVWWLQRISAYTRKVAKPAVAAVVSCPLLLIRFEQWWVDLTLPVALFAVAYIVATLLLRLERDDREVLAAVRRRLSSTSNRANQYGPGEPHAVVPKDSNHRD